MAGRLAELRDELYNVRHDKTRIEVDLRVATSQVRWNKFDNFLSFLIGIFSDFFSGRKTSTWIETFRRRRRRSAELSTNETSSRFVAFESRHHHGAQRIFDRRFGREQKSKISLQFWKQTFIQEVTAQRDINQKLEEGIEKYRRKLNVIKHQTGLLYKDFHEKQQQWLSERQENGQIKHQLQTEIDKNLVKLQEFDVKNIVLIDASVKSAKQLESSSDRTLLLSSLQSHWVPLVDKVWSWKIRLKYFVETSAVDKTEGFSFRQQS